MNSPRVTEHTFAQREEGCCEEVTVALTLAPKRPPTQTPDTIKSVTSSSTLSRDSLSHLSGIWAARAQVVIPLEPRNTNHLVDEEEEEEEEESVPQRAVSAGGGGGRGGSLERTFHQASTDSLKQVVEYRGQPLLGAWSKPGQTGASILQSSLSTPRLGGGGGGGGATPQSLSPSMALAGGGRTGYREGGGVEGFGRGFKHSFSGPVGSRSTTDLQKLAGAARYSKPRSNSEIFREEDLRRFRSSRPNEDSTLKPISHYGSPRQRGGRERGRSRGGGGGGGGGRYDRQRSPIPNKVSSATSGEGQRSSPRANMDETRDSDVQVKFSIPEEESEEEDDPAFRRSISDNTFVRNQTSKNLKPANPGSEPAHSSSSRRGRGQYRNPIK